MSFDNIKASKFTIQFELVLLFIFFLFANISLSQNFQRVEHLVGLGNVSENNGVAVADYDVDGDLDIFIVATAKDNSTNINTLSRLFRNDNNGSFTDVTQQAGIINLFSQDEGLEEFIGLDGFKYGVSWGDYDNDGFPDLFLTFSQKFQLWRNIGNGTFTNVTEEAGFPYFNSCSNTGATWFDYDNDGFLDIYVLDWRECSSNSLYRNLGDGTFENVTVSANIQGMGTSPSFVGFPFDFNNDGYMDIYVSNDLNLPNELFINNDTGIFIDQANQFGVNTQGDDMGISISDYNSDGFLDFFITAINLNFLLTNDGNQFFTENSLSYGINNTDWSWGTCFSDFDLDGDEDLFIANGYAIENTGDGPQSNFYYENRVKESEERFIDKSTEFGLDEISNSVEALDFDYDNDGDMDLIVTSSDRECFFYENKLLNFDDSDAGFNWLKVNLQGTVSNRDAIGTSVKLTTADNTYIRYYSGIGFLGQSLKGLHFGIADYTDIDEIEIRWPSGLVETYNNLSSNTTIKAIEGQGYEVLNISPSQKIYGCTDYTSCTYNPNANVDDGSCEYLESYNITGNVNSSFLKIETYAYPQNNSSNLQWHVSGGEIISGQGTSTIQIHWGIESSGNISVIETNSQCSSQEVSLDITLDTNNIPENISIARLWNEVLLEAIRGDFARPTVHARNLFHTSVAMYDIWAIYDEVAKPYLIGNTVNGFSSELIEFSPNDDLETSLHIAISYAMYRLLTHRFQNSPGQELAQARFDLVMENFGYDIDETTLQYETGDPIALGNYVAQTIIDYGLQDGAREVTGYDNAYYQPVNDAYALDSEFNSVITNPNRWQPLGLATFIDQGGNIVGENIPPFLSPEWGNVAPFALKEEDRVTLNRGTHNYNIYHNPSAPPYISLSEDNISSESYKKGFSMVSVWQSHLTPSDGVMWDISPNSIGNTNIEDFPTDFEDYDSYFNFFDGGANSAGHNINPITGNPYNSNIVPRGDYTRVLAEFWADGPDSETPPGHWFTILNYVNDHPLFEKRFQGMGEILDALEWDVKAYFILGGGMHDAAISAWSVKGWYDYIRPISAIRAMAEKGQSTNSSLPNYNIAGIPLIPEYIELIEEGDALAGDNNENVNKVKLFTWRGHDFIENEETDEAGVGWILAEKWYPYQRPTFVTPPFAGYVSGHSTFSRTAAELLTNLTGSEYFPGGLGEFTARANEFLVFEEGPSVDVVLQWATYRDASDQTSLSRIWGGIHPPADDLPGRFIGEKVANDTFNFAIPYFSSLLDVEDYENEISVFPNPTSGELFISNINFEDKIGIYDLSGRQIKIDKLIHNFIDKQTSIKISGSDGLYLLKVNNSTTTFILKK